jgi:hypothetical protein
MTKKCLARLHSKNLEGERHMDNESVMNKFFISLAVFFGLISALFFILIFVIKDDVITRIFPTFINNLLLGAILLVLLAIYRRLP